MDEFLNWREIDYAPVSGELTPDVLEAHLKPGMSVLELGCGKGGVAVWLANRGADVLGVDVSEDALAAARKRAAAAGVEARTRFRNFDIARSPQSLDLHDIVVAIRFFTCIPDPVRWVNAVEFAKAALRPEGVFYVRDFALSPEGYASRYEKGMSYGWGYGVFDAPVSNSGRVFVAKHHCDADIARLCEGFAVQSLAYADGVSMNGNRCRMFELVALR